jgi:hypothetical protein
MLFAIHQNVDEAVTNLPRGSKCACMKTFAPNGAPPRERAVTSTREANGQTNHAARKGRVVVGLYQQMKMIVLHAEVHDAKPPPRSGGEPPPQGCKHDGRAQTGQTPRPAQRDVHGVPLAMPWAGAMGFAVMGSPGPARGARLKRQRELPSSFHWRGVLITYRYANCNLKKIGDDALLIIGRVRSPCVREKKWTPTSSGRARSPDFSISVEARSPSHESHCVARAVRWGRGSGVPRNSALALGFGPADSAKSTLSRRLGAGATAMLERERGSTRSVP